MVESEEIDTQSHVGNLDRTIHAVIDFDDAVAAVRNWAVDKANVTIVVAADHETGGLEVISNQGVSQLPQATWCVSKILPSCAGGYQMGSRKLGSFGHSNAPVSIFASGPGSKSFANQTPDLRAIHATISAIITNSPTPMN